MGSFEGNQPVCICSQVYVGLPAPSDFYETVQFTEHRILISMRAMTRNKEINVIAKDNKIKIHKMYYSLFQLLTGKICIKERDNLNNII